MPVQGPGTGQACRAWWRLPKSHSSSRRSPRTKGPRAPLSGADSRRGGGSNLRPNGCSVLHFSEGLCSQGDRYAVSGSNPSSGGWENTETFCKGRRGTPVPPKSPPRHPKADAEARTPSQGASAGCAGGRGSIQATVTIEPRLGPGVRSMARITVTNLSVSTRVSETEPSLADSRRIC